MCVCICVCVVMYIKYSWTLFSSSSVFIILCHTDDIFEALKMQTYCLVKTKAQVNQELRTNVYSLSFSFIMGLDQHNQNLFIYKHLV